MKPPPFVYLAPDSLEGALTILEEKGDEAKLLAGGQSLVPAMNFRLIQPSILVDLNNLPELDYIQPTEEGGLRLGAMTRQRTMERSALVAERAPLLFEAVPYIAHPPIRNRGTLGGSLVHADPASELPVIALALDARMRVRSLSAERWVSARDFFLFLFTTDLAAQEMLIEVELPPMPVRTGWSFMEFSRRKGDYALMGVAALVTLGEDGRCENARLVYLNAGDTPLEAARAAGMLFGETHSVELFEAVAHAAASEEIHPLGNVHASVDYQRHLARVLTRRALSQAWERAVNLLERGE